ncbi:putative xanthine dehydrogenase subunit A [subsurface metagenome]
MKNIYVHLLKEMKKQKPLVLATIVETKGSTPQVSGASAIFSSERLLDGTLGGGLLEADAQKKALKTLRKKVSLLSEFSLKADISSEEGAICGGGVKILIDASPEVHRNTFQDLSQSLTKRRPGILATFINSLSEEKASIFRYWIERREKLEVDPGEHLSLFKKEIITTFSEGKPFFLKVKKEIFPEKAKERFLFLEPIFPLPQLVIAGAGHVGQAVTHLGSLLNFEVTVIDDRPEYANKEKLPDADHIIVDEIGNAIQNFPISSDTYFVIVTRGHKHDGAALRQCISSEAAYIGMIGSIRKIKLMRKKFLEEGWATVPQFDRVCAPIGIAIQSKTVEEIAVSIAAQLVLVRSQI